MCLAQEHNIMSSGPHSCLDTNFASETYVSQFSHHKNNIDKVPVLFFPAMVSIQTTVKPQAGHRQGYGKKERKWKNGNYTVTRFIVWLFVGYSTCINRDKKEMAYCQINAQMSGKYGSQGIISNANGKFWNHHLWANKAWNKNKSLQTSCRVSVL